MASKLLNFAWDFHWGIRMKNLLAIAAVAFSAVMVSAPAFASVQPLPEPLSLSLLAGGVVAIAAVKRLRRR